MDAQAIAAMLAAQTVPAYPKWVRRAQHLGDVLCQTPDEEAQLLADYKAQCEADAKAAAEQAEAEAAEAKKQAELTLKAKK